MRGLIPWCLGAAASAVAWLVAVPAEAAQCQPPGGFNAFIVQFKAESARKGISPGVLAVLDGLTSDQRVLNLDRNQKAFRMSFEQFAAQRITSGRLNKGRALLQRHADLLASIERRYGVPGPVIVAIWGLETDFGGNVGNMSSIRSLATLAHDCRRTEMFQNELYSALKVIQRGDMSASQMRGAWAGELGQTQFLASNYVKFAVDYDGNGRRDLIRSVPDALGSTGNYLKAHGWRRGQPWHEGTANFRVIQKWNKASVYSRTIALFATRLAGG